MKLTTRLSDNDYEALSSTYEQTPPELSGTPGFLTNMREQFLITELLPPNYADIVKAKAKAMSITPSEVIQYAIKAQLVENT